MMTIVTGRKNSIDYRLSREIMHLVVSVSPYVSRLFVCALLVEPFNLWPTKSNKSHYQSNVFACVSVPRGHVPIITWMLSVDLDVDPLHPLNFLPLGVDH